jgi:hypothetical protein
MAALLSVTAVLSACGTSRSSLSKRVVIADRSCVQSESSIAELASRSTLVAEVSATSSSSQEQISQIPFTSTVVQVNRIIAGTTPAGGNQLVVRQTGPATSESGAPYKTITAGNQYLVFLQPYVGPSPSTLGPEYITVGCPFSGVYSILGSQVSQLSPTDGNLPDNVTLSQIESQISAAAPTSTTTSSTTQ